MSNNYNSNLQSNNTDLQIILNTINELSNAECPDLVLQTKTVNPTTSSQTVTPDSGYDGFSQVTVNAMPTATQATPSISINASGFITATATQTEGYVAAGTKFGTKQLTTQSAKTITPTTTNQTAVSSGVYTTGAVTVYGDSNLVAENIKSGVSIFGVNGVYDGKDMDIEDSLVNKTIVNYTNNRVTTIGSNAFANCSNLTSVSFPVATTICKSAFYSCSNLTSVSFPAATNIGSNAFDDCSNLTSVSFPVATSIGNCAFNACSNLTSISFPVATTIDAYAFNYCSKLTTASFPAATSIGVSAFHSCRNLTSVSFPVATTIGNTAFHYCSNLTTASFPAATTIVSAAFAQCFKLKSLYLLGSSVCKLTNSNAFNSTPIGGYTTYTGAYGSIYVPASLMESYKTATNWAYFSNRFVTDEDFYITPIKAQNIYVDTTTKIYTDIFVKNGVNAPTISISSNNEAIATISNVIITNNNISFDIITYDIEGAAIITIDATNENCSQTRTFNISVWEEMPPPSYTIEAIDGATYGFALNANEYYESQNKGKNSSYAICKVNINSATDAIMYVDCINYAESSYDYGILSNLNTGLNLDYSADTSNVYHNFKGKSNSGVQTVTYNITAGEHFIYIKFIKDSSASSNNDSLQFKIRFE